MVSGAPGDDPASLELRDLVDELDRRPGVEAVSWFLGSSRTVPARDDERIVDELRTDWRMARVDRLLGASVGARVRGARLRWWVRSVRPDVVVLDDGLGAHLFGDLSQHRVVVRLTSRLEVDPVGGSVFAGRPAAVLAESVDDPRLVDGVPVVPFVHRRDRTTARAMCRFDERATARAAAGLPSSERLVVGWSSDPWNESGDLFVRTLWHAHRSGHRWHGCWLADPLGASVDHVLDEARRCGVLDHLDVRQDTHDELECVADLVWLPARHGVDTERVRNVLCAGVPVATFEGVHVGIESPDIQRVPDLDLPVLAATVDSVDDDGRHARAARADAEFGVAAVADTLLAVLDGAR